MHLVGRTRGCSKATCYVLLGGCVPSVLAGIFHVPFPWAALTFAEVGEFTAINSSLPGSTVIEQCGSSLPLVLCR